MGSNAERMMALFDGCRGAHGTHGAMEKNPSKGGKLEIKKTARTLREPVTLGLWNRHLEGDYFLGIIPVSENGTTTFGCIDVDRYDINLGDTVKLLKKNKIPMVVCRSKSGGAHVYVFLKSHTPASELRTWLRQVAARLGWGDCEIFPKQNQILFERGDLGSWLNMPYYDAKKPDRYGVKESTSAMTLSEFLNVAEASKIDISAVEIDAKVGEEDDGLKDGPPCLQHLCSVGFPEGQKNNGFFALATFCKKKFGSDWKEALERLNRRHFDPPRPADEVTDVMKRMDSKDYNYRCKDVPLVNHCNSTLCRGRKYGVGGGGKYPTISGLSKLMTEPKIWFVDIEDHRVELNSKELREYRDFQLACMEQLSILFLPMKGADWIAMVSDAMESCVDIEAPKEMSTTGHFMELLEDFLMDRYRGERREDLLLGKPWLNEEDGRFYFRLKDFMKHLERERFTLWGRNEVGKVIGQIGGKRTLWVKGSTIGTFWVNKDFAESPGEPDLPETREDPV